MASGSASAHHSQLCMLARGDAEAHFANYQALACKLERSGDDEDLRISTTEALISYMRVITDANALTLKPSGGVTTSDTPENIALWKKYSDTALGLATQLAKGPKKDSAAVAALYAEALTYKESSRGIIKSATTGGAVYFIAATGTLYRKHRLHDEAVSCIYMGAFQLAAPWPLGNARRGKEFFDEAYAAFPESRRNRYYAAIGAWAVGDRERTVKLMRESLAAPRAPQESSELDIESFLDTAARHALAALGETGAGKTTRVEVKKGAMPKITRVELKKGTMPMAAPTPGGLLIHSVLAACTALILALMMVLAAPVLLPTLIFLPPRKCSRHDVS